MRGDENGQSGREDCFSWWVWFIFIYSTVANYKLGHSGKTTSAPKRWIGLTAYWWNWSHLITFVECICSEPNLNLDTVVKKTYVFRKGVKGVLVILFFFCKNTTLDAKRRKLTKRGKITPLLRANYERNYIFEGQIEIRPELKNVILGSKTQKRTR